MLIDALQIQLFERSLSVLLIGMNGESYYSAEKVWSDKDSSSICITKQRHSTKLAQLCRPIRFPIVFMHEVANRLIRANSVFLRHLSCFFFLFLFTARCTLVQSAVLRSHVVCLSVSLSVCLSVTLVNCDHIGWNSSKIISPSVSLGCSLFATPTWRVYSKENTPNFLPEKGWGAEKMGLSVQKL